MLRVDLTETEKDEIWRNCVTTLVSLPGFDPTIPENAEIIKNLYMYVLNKTVVVLRTATTIKVVKRSILGISSAVAVCLGVSIVMDPENADKAIVALITDIIVTTVLSALVDIIGKRKMNEVDDEVRKEMTKLISDITGI